MYDMSIILIWDIPYSYKIFYMSMEYSIWVWKKKTFTSDFKTYLGYSICVWSIIFFHTYIEYPKRV